MALFESKESKAARRQVRIKTATKKVERYVLDCRKMAGKYFEHAKRAIKVNDSQGCDQYLYNRILYMRQADKWGAFLLRMEDLQMRGQMANAMGNMMGVMQDLTREMQTAASPGAMSRIVSDLNLASEKLSQAEEIFSGFMEQLSLEVGSPMETQVSDIPEEMQEELVLLRRQITDELTVDAGASRSGLHLGDDVDSRIKSGRERLQSLKTK